MIINGKVYCKHCRYLRDEWNLSIGHFNCAHPSNTEQAINETAYERVEYTHYKKTADELNKNNDCPNHK